METLIFTCPKCGKNELGSVEQVVLTYPVKSIPEDGDLDYDFACLWCSMKPKIGQMN